MATREKLSRRTELKVSFGSAEAYLDTHQHRCIVVSSGGGGGGGISGLDSELR